MTDYTVRISDKAIKEIELLPAYIVKKVLLKLEELESQPRPHGVKKLSGEVNKWRVRVGDYRLIYKIEDLPKVVTILFVRHRKDAYRF